MPHNHRAPASEVLWAHLLRKDTLAQPPYAEVIRPPIAPVDKTGTSIRILLHDTQANLDNFSASVDAMSAGMTEAKREIVAVKAMFQAEHETLASEIYDSGT